MVARPHPRLAGAGGALLGCLLAGPLACEPEPPLPPPPEDPFSAAPRCTSGELWHRNRQEGPEHLPGSPCNRCHHEDNAASGHGEAPIFNFAGTVYPTAHEPELCIAPAGMGGQVVVVYESGQVAIAPINATGNFMHHAEANAGAYLAKVIWNGRERQKRNPQTEGDCNTCHSAEGHEGAPGRFVLP
jgi:hypothetical protein